MRRFTILGLMVAILSIAVGFAALRGANPYWAGASILVAALLPAIAAIAATCGDDSRRAGRVGFAAMGGAYFAVAFLGLAAANLAKLPTSMILDAIGRRAVPTKIEVVYTISRPISAVTTSASFNTLYATPTKARPARTVAQKVTRSVPAKEPNPWLATLPGAADHASFSAVGHSEFALLFGLVGSLIATRFDAAKRRRPSPETPG